MESAVQNAITKLEKYYDRLSPTVSIALILDPRKKLKFFQTIKWEESWIESAEQSFREAYDYYKTLYPTLESTPDTTPIWDLESESRRRYFKNKRAKIEIPDEVESYLNSPLLGDNLNPLEWWKGQAKYFPTLHRMARVTKG